MRALLALIAFAAFFAGSPAQATSYAISLSVGAGSVTGVIETNGVNGELSASDVVDWNLVINNGVSSFNLFGPLSGNNSQGLVSGPGFTATPTGLFLDFSQRPFALFQSPFAGSGTNGFGVNCSGNLMIVVGARAVSVADPQGTFKLASVAAAELGTELHVPVNAGNDGRGVNTEITPEANETAQASSPGLRPRSAAAWFRDRSRDYSTCANVDSHAGSRSAFCHLHGLALDLIARGQFHH
jgi:hypothetical protein